MQNYLYLEHLSISTGIGVAVLDTAGRLLFESSVVKETAEFLEVLHSKLDCAESCRIAFLYACYQARRFGGRYVFFAPSGLCYTAATLLDKKGRMLCGVLAGPFLMCDYDEFIEYDILDHIKLPQQDIDSLKQGINAVPSITPARAHAISEHLHYVTATYPSYTDEDVDIPIQTDMFSSAYPIEKEDELLSAISKGNIHTANDLLSDIIRQILSHYGGNVEVLRSRVVELTVLLSRAALKGGADINEILGLNYEYLREIDSFSSVEDIVLWLHNATRRFTKHVFDFSGAKHMDIIYKAVEYIKRNFSRKITLKEIADHLFISQQYFCRIFKEETGQTPGGYITFVRIEESKKLLRNSDINIIDIPELVGFESQSYFTRIFKKETGQTPGRYRRENLALR